MIRQRLCTTFDDLHSLVVTHWNVHRALKLIVQSVDQLKLIVAKRNPSALRCYQHLLVGRLQFPQQRSIVLV